jgi:hypothetical protein
MTTRASKALLLFALGFYYTLVVFNNTNDYNSNLTFVRHVLLMDTTYPGNHGMWRSIHAPMVPVAFLCDHRGLGNCDRCSLLVGRNSPGTQSALQRGHVQCRQEAGDRGANVEPADVVVGLSERGKRMVSDVAVQGMERRDGSRSHVRGGGHYSALPRHARYGGSSLALTGCGLYSMEKETADPSTALGMTKVSQVLG